MGSREVTDSCVQTMSCLFPPEVITIGELDVRESSSAFQISLPVSLLKATTQAPATVDALPFPSGPETAFPSLRSARTFPPMKRISRSPSINGDGSPGDHTTWHSFSRFFCQQTPPLPSPPHHTLPTT